MSLAASVFACNVVRQVLYDVAAIEKLELRASKITPSVWFGIGRVRKGVLRKPARLSGFEADGEDGTLVYAPELPLVIVVVVLVTALVFAALLSPLFMLYFTVVMYWRTAQDARAEYIKLNAWFWRPDGFCERITKVSVALFLFAALGKLVVS